MNVSLQFVLLMFEVSPQDIDFMMGTHSIVCSSMCHILFTLLAISGPPAQLHVLKTQTLEHSHLEHYSGSPDLCYVSSFLFPFWFIYIHTSYCFIYSSDPVSSCVHHSGLQVPNMQLQYVVTWLQTFSNLHCSITNPMYSLLVYKLIVQLLYSLALLSI